MTGQKMPRRKAWKALPRGYGTEQRSCARKHRYPTAEEASCRAKDLRCQGFPAVIAYGCRHCGGWHVGHDRSGKWGPGDAVAWVHQRPSWWPKNLPVGAPKPEPGASA